MTDNVVPLRPTQTCEYEGQRYVLEFKPGEGWCWVVYFTRTYRYFGAAPTKTAAKRLAREQIQKLLGRERLSMNPP